MTSRELPLGRAFAIGWQPSKDPPAGFLKAKTFGRLEKVQKAHIIHIEVDHKCVSIWTDWRVNYFWRFVCCQNTFYLEDRCVHATNLDKKLGILFRPLMSSASKFDIVGYLFLEGQALYGVVKTEVFSSSLCDMTLRLYCDF